MKATSMWVLAAAVAMGLGLQGCAGNSGLTYANGAAPSAHSSAAAGTWEATGSNTAIETKASSNQPVVKADTKANFEAVEAAIKQQMGQGGRWQYVTPGERTTIEGNFADMAKIYDRYGDVAKMDASVKMRVLADQGSINAILTKRDGDKLICKSEIPVGSHLPVKTCRTYAQMQAEERLAQRSLMQENLSSNRQKRVGK